MNVRSLQAGSVATNVLLPWLLLLLIVSGLMGYRYHQTQAFAVLEAHSALHRKAVLLANDLRFLAQERLSIVLAYQTTHDAQIIRRLQGSEIESVRMANELELLFANEEGHHIAGMGNQDKALLDSYRLMRAGRADLYKQFILAVDKGDISHQARLIGLMFDKSRLISAALDDLATYHLKTEQLVEANRLKSRQQAEWQFFGLLGALMLVGAIFSRYQTLAIVRPLTDLTLAAQRVGAGETADLARFKGKGEIGKLSSALSTMVGALRQSHQEISAQKDQLALAYAEVEEKVRQRTAELRLRTDELETANKDLEGFSYSVSHDLRAPLRAIDGFIAILQEDYAGNLDAEGQRLFGIVSDNARKMGHLIDDILAFSRAGRLGLENVTVDMNTLVDEVWAGFADQRGERPIEFARADLPTVSADVRALRQVWQNILGNALKFSRNRNPAKIEVNAARQGDMVWFSVRDNGAGFNLDYKDKLFGLFQRLHGMDEFEGTGVGLAIVKRFVLKHGGQVAAVGAVNAGATFSFGLPAGPVQALSEKE